MYWLDVISSEHQKYRPTLKIHVLFEIIQASPRRAS